MRRYRPRPHAHDAPRWQSQACRRAWLSLVADLLDLVDGARLSQGPSRRFIFDEHLHVNLGGGRNVPAFYELSCTKMRYYN